MSGSRPCDACGSPLAADQQYCLVCGTRAGGRSELLQGLLERVREGEAPGGAGAGHGEEEPAGAGASPPRWEPRLPGPLVSLALVLLFVGFGALLGDAGAGAGRLTAATSPLKVLIRQHPAASNAGGGSASTSEPPASEPEPTPVPSESPESPPEEHAAAGTAPKHASTQPGGGKAKPPPAKGSAAKLSDIKHVFVIVLSDEPYAADFGPESKATYLAHTLESKGELLLRYDAIAHEQLPNGIALLSGQGPTAQTAANCPSYTPLTPATLGGDGQVLGDGCVYPADVQSLPTQLSAKHLTWKAYVQGIDEGAGTPPACSHPAAGGADPTYTSGSYATYRNPFVYFQAIADSPACLTQDVGLDELQGDLGSASSTPAFSYIVPDRCEDAGPTPCAPGAPASAADAAGLLAKLVPEITSSTAYKKGGLLVITSDEAPSTGEYADSSSCCGQPPYPNLTTAGLRHGGGVVGALLLSPFIKGGTTAQEPYNHYSLLRTVEDVFGLSHLGYAALPTVKSFSASLLNGAAKG